MRVAERLGRVGRCFLPKEYSRLAVDSFRTIWLTLFSAFVLFALLSLLVAVPVLLTLSDRTQEAFSSIDSFVLDAKVNQSAPVVLFASPRVVLDADALNRSTEGLLLFGKKGIFLDSPGEDDFWSWDQVKDISAHSDKLGSFLALAILVLIPALLVLALFFCTVSVFVLSAVFSLLGFFWTKIFGYSIGLNQVIKVSLFASVPFLTLALLSLPIFFLWWLPLSVFFIYFVLGVWIVGERKFAE